MGTWTRIDNGIEELTFTKDNTAIQRFYSNIVNDFEEVKTYTIIDNVLFMDNTIIEYTVKKDTLILSWGGLYAAVYSKNKHTHNLDKTRKQLSGIWVFSAFDAQFEIEFIKDDLVKIREYKDGGIIRIPILC